MTTKPKVQIQAWLPKQAEHEFGDLKEFGGTVTRKISADYEVIQGSDAEDPDAWIHLSFDSEDRPNYYDPSGPPTVWAFKDPDDWLVRWNSDPEQSTYGVRTDQPLRAIERALRLFFTPTDDTTEQQLICLRVEELTTLWAYADDLKAKLDRRERQLVDAYVTALDLMAKIDDPPTEHMKQIGGWLLKRFTSIVDAGTGTVTKAAAVEHFAPGTIEQLVDAAMKIAGG